MWRLIAPWVRLASSAAASKQPSRAAAAKAGSASSGGILTTCQFSAQINANYSLESAIICSKTLKKDALGKRAITTEEQVEMAPQPTPSPRQAFAAACGIHKGSTGTLYLLPPLWRAEFTLSYAAVGVPRALYSAVLAGPQVRAAGLAAHI